MAKGDFRCSSVSRSGAQAIADGTVFAAAAALGAAGWGHEAAIAQETAETEAISYAIPRGPLGPAVTAFGNVSGLQVLFPAQRVNGLTTRGVSGTMAPGRALNRLLAGTGLVYQFTTANTVTIVDPQSETGQMAPPTDGSTLLDQLVVAGQGLEATGSGWRGTPDWVYSEATSTSAISREAIQGGAARNTSDLFSDTSGTYAVDSPQNPGVNVNIRGLQDQNRVTMMIDGARQNFQRNGHSATANAYLDPSMLRMVEVNKSAGTGVGDAGSLGGSVNFRTLEARDVVKPGERVGGELNLTTGTNEYNFDGSASAAVIEDTFSVLGAISFKTLGEYEIGQNGEITNFSGNLMGAPIFTGLDAGSGLLKAEADLGPDLKMDLSWLGYKGEFSTGTEQYTNTDTVTNHTFNSHFKWNPESPLVDARLGVWLNDTTADQFRKARSSYDAFDVTYATESIGLSLENTSTFNLPEGNLSLDYGLEVFKDIASTDARAANPDDDPGSLWFSGPNPEGSRTMASAFSTASYERDWLTLQAGLRYDHYELNGSSQVHAGRKPAYKSVRECEEYGVIITACTKDEYEDLRSAFLPLPDSIPLGNPANWPDWPSGRPASGLYVTRQVQDGWTQVYDDIAVQSSGGRTLPAASVSVEPVEGFEFFANYSEGYRPPTVMEAMLGGEHIGGFGLRFGPNPSLNPEHSRTWEVGTNLSFDNVLLDGDRLRFKGVAYDRRVTDYIALGFVDVQTSIGPNTYQGYVNLDGTTRMRGLELEANYDAGFAYAGGSFTYIDTDYATTYTRDGASDNTEQLLIFAPPKVKYSLDAGVRLVDEKLMLGGRVNHVAESEYLGNASGQSQAEGYTTLDIYGSYDVNPDTELSFAINNVTDAAYVPVFGQPESPAPGRTATLSLKARF